MFKKEPATVRFSIQGNDGPWKNNLLDVFKGQKRKTTLTVEQRARPNFELLTKTCKNMDQVDCSVWPNLRVAYVLGFVTMCRRLGVICKNKKYKKGNIRLGIKSASIYAIVSGDSKEAAIKKLAMDVTAALAISDMEVARSLEDCLRIMTAVIKYLKKHPAPLLQLGHGKSVDIKDAPYSVKWTVRSAIISQLRAAGCKRMVIRKGDTLSMMTRVFPDQGRYVFRLGKKFNTSSFQELFKKMKYTDPVEFFSMYMCFYGSPTLDQYDHVVIGKKQVAMAKKYMEDRKTKLGVYLIPPEAIKAMVEEGVI